MSASFEKHDSVDILKIGHDEILQLYRGWKRSDSLLKDKTKEVSELRKRLEELQEAHVKFHGQLQSLRSVKELTVSLQTQLATLQQENIMLANENKQWKDKCHNLDKEFREGSDKQHEQLRDAQIDQAILRGRCQELSLTQVHLEAKLNDEKTMRQSTEKLLENCQKQSDKLLEENNLLKEELAVVNKKVEQCDRELAVAANQLSTLSKEVTHFTATKEKLNNTESEVALLKGDISRLLHLIDHHNFAGGFVGQWKDSNGMTFIGPAVGKDSDENPLDQSDSMNDDEDLISPSEYAHLQRTYGGDPFPISSSWEEELEQWSPHDLVTNGLKFVENKMPHISKSLIMDFIGGMNKIWMRREKRKILRIKERYERVLSDLQRQISNSRPYREIITEATVKRLQSQVKEKRVKALSGRPKKFHELSWEERNYFLAEDEYGDVEQDENILHHHKLCMIPKKGSKAHIRDLTANKLLVASLESLESVGRHLGHSHTRGRSSSPSQQRYNNPVRFSSDFSDDEDYTSNKQPSGEYIRGALWLGRNFVAVMEDLCAAFESIRQHSMKDITLAMQDSDKVRACHRLTLLANSIVTEYTTLVQRVGLKSRSILQGAASLAPGDLAAYDKFVKSLPIEASLNQRINEAANELSQLRTQRSPALSTPQESPN